MSIPLNPSAPDRAHSCSHRSFRRAWWGPAVRQARSSGSIRSGGAPLSSCRRRSTAIPRGRRIKSGCLRPSIRACEGGVGRRERAPRHSQRHAPSGAATGRSVERMPPAEPGKPRVVTVRRYKRAVVLERHRGQAGILNQIPATVRRRAGTVHARRAPSPR